MKFDVVDLTTSAPNLVTRAQSREEMAIDEMNKAETALPSKQAGHVAKAQVWATLALVTRMEITNEQANV